MNTKCSLSSWRVAIIGAGASGLTAARQALDYGFEPVIFEQSGNYGGLWNYKPEETDQASVMKSTVINTSKEMTAFSDFPPSAESANFMHHRKMHDYLKKYAAHFQLQKFTRFLTKVEGICRSVDYKRNGKWTVTSTDCNSNQVNEELFDAVLLCTGHHAEPNVPEKWPGQDTFKGAVIHSHSYKDHCGFEDKMVAVVGVGNSGVDVAVELSRIGSQVYLVSRRGTWVLNRNMENSIPIDLALNCRYLFALLNCVPSWLSSRSMQAMVEKKMDHEAYGLKPKHDVFAAHWTINDELSNRLSCGTVVVKPNLQRFTENGLVFEDGSEVEHVDYVILATGYKFGFPILENGELIKVENNMVNLYKYIFPLETSDFNSLGVIGCIQPLGSIMPIAEIQARVFFEAFTGGVRLPDRELMAKDVNNKHEELAQRYINSMRHTIQVDYVPYMDELASIIGCKPNIAKLLVTDPVLAYHLFFGPNYPYVYRISGPKTWRGARQAILEADVRRRCGMRAEHRLKSNDKDSSAKECASTGVGTVALATIWAMSSTVSVIKMLAAFALIIVLLLWTWIM